MRDYDPTTGRYIEPDPLGLIDGPDVYGYARQSPGKYVDPNGLASRQHITGKTIQCGLNCTIRIDSTLVGGKELIRHLHWECKGGLEGVCGEFGETSHGGTWDEVPEHIKQCALANGFNFEKQAPGSNEMSYSDYIIGGVVVVIVGGVIVIGGTVAGGALVLGGGVVMMAQ
jgi:uncharacterized protein RhaS with RHS repeats